MGARVAEGFCGGLFDLDASDFEAAALGALKRVELALGRFGLDPEQPQFELALRRSVGIYGRLVFLHPKPSVDPTDHRAPNSPA